MKLRTYLAIITTLFLFSAAFVIKRAIDERRKPIEPTQHALVDSYMWRWHSDTPHKPQYGDIILTASSDTSVCWIEVPCDSNALYRWHVKEIQRLQKKRLWGSEDGKRKVYYYKAGPFPHERGGIDSIYLMPEHKHRLGGFWEGHFEKINGEWYEVTGGVCERCDAPMIDTVPVSSALVTVDTLALRNSSMLRKNEALMEFMNEPPLSPAEVWELLRLYPNDSSNPKHYAHEIWLNKMAAKKSIYPMPRPQDQKQ